MDNEIIKNELNKVEEKKFDFKKYTGTSNSWSFKIDDMDFTCDEISAGEEIDYYNFYIDPQGKENPAKITLVRATKLIECPFTKEWIEHVFKEFYPKIELPEKHEWKNLSFLLRLSFLEKLDLILIGKLCREMTNHYIGKEAEIKNV